MASPQQQPQVQQRVNAVQLDGLALLKILTHSQESIPDLVTGQLVGLDVDGRVEVTNSFPFPNNNNPADNDHYQLEMLKSLRTVNVDHNTIGWYTSTYFANFYSSSTIEHQLSYQLSIPNSIMIVYDPFTSTKGKLQLKAFRLTQQFIEATERIGAKSTSTAAALTAAVITVCHELQWFDIFEELDIKVHNSHLVHGFLYELRESQQFGCESERLGMWPWSGPFLTRAMTLLSDSVDDYTHEASRLAYYQRQLWRQKQAQQAYSTKVQGDNNLRVQAGKEALPEEDKSKNPLFKAIPRPARVEAHAAANQIAYAAAQIQQTANQGIHKLYLTAALHQK